MTQIINDKLKKICNNCRCDKSCAWISLGNEYCDDIMEAQHEIERLNNIIDELHILFIEFDRNVMRRKYIDANMINLEIKAKLRELKEGKQW